MVRVTEGKRAIKVCRQAESRAAMKCAAQGLSGWRAPHIVMPALARAKYRVAEQLGGDPLILADAAETKICVLLSISTLAGWSLTP
jgi:hypothetical protein